jgi:purine-binding chemotaxis protein CheW
MPSLIRGRTKRPELDWQSARERLAKLARGEFGLDAESRQRLLEERARLLARPQRKDARLQGGARAGSELELLQFSLGQERFAIETRFVHQLLVPGVLTRVPGAPAQLRGVTNLRGEILPVFDLRELLAQTHAPSSDSARWLVLGAREPELCMLVDAVQEIIDLEPSALSASERAADFVLGVTQDARSVLHAARLLAHRDLFIGEAAPRAQEELP